MLSSQNPWCFFLQPWFPLNAEQMLEIQGFSSAAHYHLNAGVLYSSFLLLFNLPALLVAMTYRLTQKLCMSHKVKIAKFIHYLYIWVLYSYIIFHLKTSVNIWMSRILLRVEWVVLSCIAKARCQLVSIWHGPISQVLFSAWLFMWLFFCVFYTQILQEATSLWSKRWIFQLFLVLIAYVHVLDFFTHTLNLHGSCGNHSWLALKGLMTLC